MSYFNEDQQAYMASLAATPDEERCYCGWDRFGECYNCKQDEFTKTRTRADRVKLSCPHCGNYPSREGQEISHNIKCPTRTTNG